MSSGLSPQFKRDLLRESMLDDNISHFQCLKIAQKIQNKSDTIMPFECLKHGDVLKSLLSPNKNAQDSPALSDAFEGMRAGSAASARAARAKGQLNHAQVQRRLTQTRSFSKDS
eukprot:CAMPEP_0178488568 /NCGR_PEP_ID=MMETSP0696-20121128/9926_1 /TAXON_ID=265572 /ORGANISM="Extubocellulus spinifer, Strain CCMP396" /LENGTH=113 /DNA_ID=CAMNT_0020116339 /DNA_START=107 /DNA_END=448 /DNA_ORIENTATION=-